MKQLSLTLLGMPQIKLGDQLVIDLPSRKARALLIYLAITKQLHSRQQLAGLLWGEMTEENARRNLRVLLTRLRKRLTPFLDIQRRDLGINPDSDVWIDVVEFESCLAPTEPTLQQLHRAAKLYQGHFLDGFDLRDAPLFEEWQRPLQERYRQLAMDALYRLAVYHTQQKQYSMGIDFTGQLLALEPWMEEAHRQMMLLQALSGQRTAALTQYETCRNVLMEEIGVEPSEATITLYQQILHEEIDVDMDRPAIIPSAETAPWTPPFQAPAVPAHFVGRANLQDTVVAAVKTAVSSQLHALVGMGGIGKSTLTIQLAHTLRDTFPDGVLWANVAASEPMSILESWAQRYGYDFTRIADVENMAVAFRGVLADKSVLIVLDDVTSVARIRPLLPTGNHNQVLLTTRDQDLAHALHAQVWPLDELSEENGRLLFTHLLGEKRVNAELDAAADICNLLQNLPLAIEIMAQRLKSRPRRRLVDMATRLKDETKRLSQLNISDQGVRASFGISWETLDEGQRQVFRVMGLFNGRSFTANTIAYILDQDTYLTEDRLYALTNLSLVSEEGQTRYRQHALLADFAREKLEEGEVEGVNGRLAQHYLQFAQQHPHDYDILRPEWDNMMAAMQTAHDHQLWQTVIDFADALHDAWFTRGRFTQARQGLAIAHEAAMTVNNNHKDAKILLLWGKAAVEQYAHDEAHNLYEKSRKIFSNINDLTGVANCQCEMARIALEQSKTTDAMKLLNASRDIRQAMNDVNGVAETHYIDARVAYFRGDYAHAEQMTNEALTIQEKLDDTFRLIDTLSLKASTAIHLENLDRAEEFAKRAHILCEQTDNQSERAIILDVLADIYRRRSQFNRAEKFARESLKMLIRFGDLGSQANVMYQLSRIFKGKGLFEKAISLGQESLALSSKLQYTILEALILLHLGETYLLITALALAKTHLKQALALGKQLKHPFIIENAKKQLQTLDQN